MKLKLTLERSGAGSGTDVLVDIDPIARVGALADALAERDPQGTAGAGIEVRALRAESSVGERVIGPDTPMADASLRSGDRISIIDGAGRYVAASDDRAPAVTLVVTAGADVGRRLPLRRGANLVGRGHDVDVVLTDRMVSKRHARINVSDVVEVIDLASANGVLVNDQPVPRAVLRTGDRILLGETELVVEDRRRTTVDVAGPEVAFNRSPYLDPRHPERTVVAPALPSSPARPRLPAAALVAPLLMGLVLYAFTRRLISVVFVALSPLLMLGNFLEGRRSHKLALRDATDAFGRDVALMVDDLDRGLAEEAARRRLEHPPCSQVVAAARARAPMLWARRPDRPGFLELRLGTATLPSRTTIDVNLVNSAIPGTRDALLDAIEPRRQVADVPVVGSMREHGSIGVSGAGDDARGAARSLLGQIAGLHSPAEVVIGAVVTADTAPQWDWVKWLPHTTSDASPILGPLWASDEQTSRDLIAALREVVDERSAATAAGDRPTSEVTAVILVEDAAAVDRSLFVDVVERGPAVGVHLIWVAPSVGRIPAGCGVFVDHDPSDHRAAVGFVDGGRALTPVAVEPLEAAAALAFARDLSPVVDAGMRADEEGDLPARVSLVEHLGADIATSAEAVVERWTLSDSLPGTGHPRRRRTLPLHAMVGSSVHEPLQLDLRGQGPHALVGGTTGAGKSEFLQTWIASLAATHSPARVTFLFVDYKGGSAFGECVNLPHSVGLVTDLTPHLVTRALRSLSAELTHRERILNAKRAKDVLELERAGDPDTPPSLLIVVDEFAALVAEVPEFVDGVVNVAQRGRSLGLHLVLATQRPAGVIRDNLRANTNLRVALRMADEADSLDVVGTDHAATFDPAIPGRAIAKVGPGRLVPFQTAYVGGWTTGDAPPPSIAVADLRIDGRTEWVEPEAPEIVTPVADPGPTDLARIVEAARGAATALDLAPPRRPWLAELQPTYDIARNPTADDDLRLISRTDSDLVFGVLDDPANQAQHPVAFRPDVDGNMLVIGTGGSGKSAFLRTLAVAAALSTRGGPCHVYGLDFASRGLDMIEELPNVGAVIGADDDERIDRLMRTLRELVDERLARFAAARADSIEAYRAVTGHHDEPRVLLLIDGYPAFRQAYEATFGRARAYDQFLSIATDGRQAGVHVVVAADRLGAIPSSLASVIQQRLVLRLASDNEYSLAGVPAAAFPTGTPPGRAFLADHEVQVAVLGGTANTAQQSSAIRRLATGLRDRGTSEAPAVGRLPTDIEWSVLPPDPGGRLVIGVEDATLGPFALDLDSTLSVVGPQRSGKTTVLRTIVHALTARAPASRTVYVGEGRSALRDDHDWAEVLEPGPDLAGAIARLTATVDGAVPGSWVVVVDDAPKVGGWPEAEAVAGLVVAASRAGHPVLADGETGAMGGTWGLVQAVKASRHAILLVPDQYDGENLFKTPLPKLRRADFPPGRGFYLRAATATKVQVAKVEA